MVRAEGWFHATNHVGDNTTLPSTTLEGATFVDSLGRAAERFPVEIHSYCAMGTHYHILARADEHDLLVALQSIDSVVASEPRRPRLCRMAFGRHLIKVTRYIHLNPVSARLVLSPEDWPWSSYRGYIDRLEAPRWLRSDAVLGWYGSIGARLRYRDEVENGGSRFPGFGS